MKNLEGRWSLVTGASSGLGADFARTLAAEGSNLVLVARREDRLRALARELEAEHRCETRVRTADLSERDAPDHIHRQLREEGLVVDVLVNNAGFGLYGAFTEIPWEREEQMLLVDVVALAHMTKLFVDDMKERDFGYVLQVASIGAYQPTPTYACYGAAKAFVLSFGEALAYELRRSRVRVTVLSPGVTRTEFLQVAGQRPTLYQRLSMMESRDVARAGIRAMLRGKTTVIPGLVNALPVWSLRLMPRRTAAALASLLMNSGERGATG